MPQKIDELQLQIGSDASNAIREIGNLAGALDMAATSARKLSGAAGYLSAFSRSIDRLANADLNKAISGLTQLSRLDLSNLKDKTVNIDVKVNGAEQAERLKYAHKDAAEEIAKDSMSIARSLGQKYHVDTQGILELSKCVKEFVRDLARGGNGAAAQDNMFKVISEHGRESEAEIMGVANEYKEFLNWYNNTHFSSTGITDTVGRGERATSGLLRNLRKDAESADGAMVELFSRFPNLFRDVNGSIDNTSDMIMAAAEKAQEARAMLEPHEIVDENTYDNIGASIQQAAETASRQFDEASSKYMRESANKIPIDLAIDQKRFEQQIQNAINAATLKKYTSKPIDVQLNTEKLKSDFSSILNGINVKDLPTFADNFGRISNAISTMNQTGGNNNGLNKFVNALRRLIEVDTSKFDVSVLNRIVSAIAATSRLSGIDKTINRFVSALTKLANAGYRTKITSDGLKLLIPILKGAVKTFQQLGAVDDKINQFINALANLANAGANTSTTANNLRGLTKEVMIFLKAVRNSPQISDNLAMTIQGLGNLAAAGEKTGQVLSNLGSSSSKGGFLNGAIGSAANSAAAGIKKLLGYTVQLGGKGVSAIGAFMQKLGLLPGHANNINRTALSFTNLLRAIVPFYGISGIFNWGKEAVTAGSSIVELENVVDTAFGDLKKGYEDISGYVYRWAEGTIDAFGVSEIAAKQYAGRLMSMFNSSGFDVTQGMRDSAAKMSTDLIERAGDIASFYDITVDEAMTKVQAGLAGMNRPLRSIGVNMTVANLEAFALSKGLNQSWQEMDQATQMALRYEYILDATQYAMGDFSRTSGTYANQVRLLSLNFQMLGATIGQGLISAIAPAISWINALIRRLIVAANAFRAFMFTLFGKAIGASKGVSDEMAGYLEDAASSAGDLGSSAGGASDGLGSAGKAAKDLKKQLTVLPFDELNQLAKDTESAGSGGSGGGGGGGGGGGIGGIGDLGLSDLSGFDIDSSPTIQAINRWAARIREAFQKKQWKNLGRIVAEGINAGFQYIYDILDWNKIKPIVVDGFIVPFQAAFNSMMEWINWELIGKTFARGLNDIVYILRAWITGFEWRKYGSYLARGMNAMIHDIDADALGRLIADKFKAAWDFFGGWVRTFDFKQLGTKIKEGIHGALDELDPKDMGESLGTFITGLGTTLRAAFEDGTLSKDISEAFSEFVNGFLETFDAKEVVSGINSAVTSIVYGIGDAILNVDWGTVVEDFGTALSNLDWGLIANTMADVAVPIIAAKLFGTALKEAAKEQIGKLGLGALFSGAFGTGGATGGATTGAGALASAGTIAGLTCTQLAIVGAVTIGGIALGLWLKQQADKSGLTKLFQFNTEGNKKNAAKTTAEGQTKNQKALNNAGINNAGYATKIQTVTPKSTAKSETTKTKHVVTTVAKGAIDNSLVKLQDKINGLKKTPVVTKTAEGKQTSNFKSMSKAFHSVMTTKATKTADGKRTSGFNTLRNYFHGIVSNKATKTADGKRTNAFNTTRTYFHGVKSNTAKKTATGEQKKNFTNLKNAFHKVVSNTATKTAKGDGKKSYWNLSGDYRGLSSKEITLSVNQKRGYFQNLGATIKDSWEKLIEFNWYAKGGYFTGASLIGVGEAGAEAVLPLTNRRTMKMIGSAISDAGGTSTPGSNAELAAEIARQLAPIIMGAMNSQSQRPMNVNAVLYTENNEVLARAVNQGNRSLDKRYHPIAQYSY